MYQRYSLKIGWYSYFFKNNYLLWLFSIINEIIVITNNYKQNTIVLKT